MKRMLLVCVSMLLASWVVGCGGVASGSEHHISSHSGALGRAHAADGLKSLTITVGGLTRSYLLYVPSGASRKHRLPLVLVYHGAGGTAQNTAGETGLLAYDQQHGGMILAFLQGIQDTWNDDTGDPPAERMNVDDIGFTKAVLGRVESTYAVNMRRVVVTGISNGAIMVELLGCRIAGDVTLVAPVEGQMGTRFSGNCRPARPVNVYEVHGTADRNIPYWGGTFSGSGGLASVLSAPASARRWAVVDHCALSASKSRDGRSVFTRYRRCGSGVIVTLNTILGGKHQWPPDFAITLARVINGLSGRRQAVKPA